MHQDHNIQELLLKFVKNECSDEEYEAVLQYFQKNSRSEDMPDVEKVLEILDSHEILDQGTADHIFQQIISQQTRNTKHRFRVFDLGRSLWKYGAAAVILLTVIAGFLFQQGIIFPELTSGVLTERSIQTTFEHTEHITLELDNGQVEVINPDGTREVRDVAGNIVGQQENSRLVYSSDQPVEKLEYNTLRIPYSKRFEIELSDGTIVYLNSGTTIKFPVHFPRNSENRVVEVIGEAYFEVAHNAAQPFIVQTGGIDVRVLGTKFNVSTYPEDDRTDVVLVEGSVSLDTKNTAFETIDSHILKPGYRASFHKVDKSIDTMTVPTSIYTSWINGELVFRDMKFEDILMKLERKYNVSIYNSNGDLAQDRFNASFGDVPLKTVLNYFRAIYNIEFSIENEKVIIQ